MGQSVPFTLWPTGTCTHVGGPLRDPPCPEPCQGGTLPSVWWFWGLGPNCRGRLGRGTRGRTHMSKQCAADRSHLSATSTAPQRCSLRRSHRLTCQGHSPGEAALPPTIRVRAAGGARPQSVEEQVQSARCGGSSSSPPYPVLCALWEGRRVVSGNTQLPPLSQPPLGHS